MVHPRLAELASLPCVRRYLPSRQEISPITSLEFDSRSAGPGTLFFALTGIHTDGHRYLDAVHQQGCRAVVVSKLPEPKFSDTAYLVVDDTRSALSPLSALFFGHPSHEIPVIGVTGTDGKSSTVWFIHQLIEAFGRPSGFFSTVQWQTGSAVEHNTWRQSTPEAPQIHGLLRQMVENGKRFAVLESTSHGLSPKTSRLADVRYACSVFTNVTSEHLEFHGDLETYRRDKSRLFSALPERGLAEAFGVVNADDPNHEIFVRAAGDRAVQLYSTQRNDVELFCRSVEEINGKLELELVWRGQVQRTVLPMPGRFNAENLMAALLAASGTISRAEGTSVSPFDLLSVVPGLVAVKGRMRAVNLGQPFNVIVDYAHTPGAFETVLPSVRSACPGRLIVVFGSGGERDHDKRPRQGTLADEWADLIVLTDEDPRLESSKAILDEIAAGIHKKTLGKTYWKIPHRPEAVRWAIGLAKKGDTVLLLGKGHEQSIVGSAGAVPYDEETEARKALQERGWNS
jgi:UDP-N-acetylmuramoyl-L-alanyl-D-glutamate--2,6-diaminopimelate ligase